MRVLLWLQQFPHIYSFYRNHLPVTLNQCTSHPCPLTTPTISPPLQFLQKLFARYSKPMRLICVPSYDSSNFPISIASTVIIYQLPLTNASLIRALLWLQQFSHLYTFYRNHLPGTLNQCASYACLLMTPTTSPSLQLLQTSFTRYSKPMRLACVPSYNSNNFLISEASTDIIYQIP